MMENVTADLVQFLRARLDEDEQTAREAGGRWLVLPVSGWVHTAPAPSDEWQHPGTDHHVASVPLDSDRAHIVRHDPARVLAEVEAKRRILADHPIERETVERPIYQGREVGGPYWEWGCANCHVDDDGLVYGFGYCLVWRALALPYAGHSDYRKEWRP